GLFVGLAVLHTGSVWFSRFPSGSGLHLTGWATVLAGGLGVFSSAMVYHDTRRDFWRLNWSGGKFFGTTALLGTATTLLIAASAGEPPPLLQTLAVAVLLSTIAKLAFEWPIFRYLEFEDFSPLAKTALLLDGRLGAIHR